MAKHPGSSAPGSITETKTTELSRFSSETRPKLHRISETEGAYLHSAGVRCDRQNFFTMEDGMNLRVWLGCVVLCTPYGWMTAAAQPTNPAPSPASASA